MAAGSLCNCCMVIAATGHTLVQAAQPLHRAGSSAGRGTPGLKRIAFSGQTSRQLWQVTPCAARQSSPIAARHGQGCSASGNNARGSHAAMHSPQNVHSPRCQSRSGNPASARTRRCAGQAVMQSLQRLQRSRNNASSTAPGGRTSISGDVPRSSARRDRSGWDVTLGTAISPVARGSFVKSRWQNRIQIRSAPIIPAPAPRSATKTPEAQCHGWTRIANWALRGPPTNRNDGCQQRSVIPPGNDDTQLAPRT